MSNYGFSIRSDDRRNVLYIEQHGQPTAADFLDLKQAFLSEVVKLREGFSIINDQREMEPYDDEAMEVAIECRRNRERIWGLQGHPHRTGRFPLHCQAFHDPRSSAEPVHVDPSELT